MKTGSTNNIISSIRNQKQETELIDLEGYGPANKRHVNRSYKETDDIKGRLAMQTEEHTNEKAYSPWVKEIDRKVTALVP